MARDRKRAKQRQQRRVREGPATGDSQPVRRNLPGPLQHTGDVDEFDAALVRGARPQGDVADEGQAGADVPGAAGAAEDLPDPGEGAPPPGALPAHQETAPGRLSRRRDGAASPERVPRANLGTRAVAFLRASWAELQRVQWPDRRQVAQATAVVLGFVVIAGAYLGAADWLAQKVVNLVL